MDPRHLVKVNRDDPEFDSVGFWSFNRAYVDKDLVFRNTATGELLVFDKDGIWSEEGLKHPLIY